MLKIGDKVRYSHNFLKSITNLHKRPELQKARGVVQNVEDREGMQVVEISWNIGGLSHFAMEKSLEKVGG